MERFFILDNCNTWYDWRCYLTEKSIQDAEPNTNYVKIDGMSGSLDLSEALTGEVTYQDRIITASFWRSDGTYKERDRLLKNIKARLHGKKVRIVEPDDPEHYFVGRIKISSSKNILPYSEFSIECMCEPWRYSISECIRQASVYGNDINLIIHNNGKKTLCPEITVSGSIIIIMEDIRVPLTGGTYKVSDIKLKQGVNIIGVSGYGTATFVYREADL